MLKNSSIITLLLIVGIFFLLTFAYIISTPYTEIEKTPALARVIDFIGDAQVIKKNLRQTELVSKSSTLSPLDSIETGADAVATLEFKSAHRIRILENSFITVDGHADQVTLIIKRGEIQVDNFGADQGVLVFKQGQTWTATDYELNVKKLLSSSITKPPEPSSSPEESIKNTLKAYRNHFYKCYHILLQKTPGVSGACTLSFNIENNGRVKNIEFVTNTFKDSLFNKCLVEALTRIQFHPFSGQSITTTLPLRFE